MLQRDAPLSDPAALGADADRLGRCNEAEKLAGILLKRMLGDKDGSFVLAISGPWGTGKTTFGEYLAYYLRRDGGANGPEILRCRLWLSAHRGHVLRGFLETMSTHAGSNALGVLDQHTDTQAVMLTALVRAELPEKPPREETVAVLGDLARVSEELRKLERRVVVYLDDVDRLGLDEMRTFLWLLKTVTGLPGVCFVVMWDGPLVAKMIGKDFPHRGDDYLARIVDVTYELSRPAPEMIWKALCEYLDASDDGPWEDSLRPVRAAGLGQLVTTLRQAKRVCNSVRVTMATRDCQDRGLLLALEGLRVLQSAVFDSLGRNPDGFVDGSWNWTGVVKKWVAAENRQAVSELLGWTRATLDTGERKAQFLACL